LFPPPLSEAGLPGPILATAAERVMGSGVRIPLAAPILKPGLLALVRNRLPPRISWRLKLFDQFVGTHEQLARHGEAERLGGLEVNDQFKRRQLLDRDIGRLCSA
jgi:hypothetical protein